METVRRLVLKLPPSSAWGARTQTLTVLGSTDNTTYATVSLPSGAGLRYLRLSASANTGRPAGQFSEVEAYPTS